MNAKTILDGLYALPLAEAVRSNDGLFPWIESAHVIAATLVVGTVAIVDFRLLGIASRGRPVSELSGEVLPWTWTAFVLAVVSGSLMFISKAPTYFDNTAFRLKMLFLALAGLNMLLFELVTYRSVKAWDRDAPAAGAARAAGFLSLALWILVVASARWIGFTTEL